MLVLEDTHSLPQSRAEGTLELRRQCCCCPFSLSSPRLPLTSLFMSSKQTSENIDCSSVCCLLFPCIMVPWDVLLSAGRLCDESLSILPTDPGIVHYIRLLSADLDNLQSGRALVPYAPLLQMSWRVNCIQQLLRRAALLFVVHILMQFNRF